jgi:ribosomal protein S12 methylthiotransferase accessory factor
MRPSTPRPIPNEADVIDVVHRPSTAEAPAIMVRGQALRAAKQFVAGTHRCVSPEETWDRIRPRLPLAGITRVADLTGLDRVGITTASAIRPNGRTLSNSAGKGFTKVAAMVSAAMEAMELFHAESRDFAYRVATHDELRAEGSAIDLDRMGLTRLSLFRPDRPEAWVRGWDLLNGCDTWVPWVTAMVTPRPAPQPTMEASMPMDSNGLASGNEFLEATCAALYEVIERDAVACQLKSEVIGRRRAPLVDIDSLDSPRIDELARKIRAAGLTAVVRDYTTDTEVPVYTAYLFDEQAHGFGTFAGSGAHLDPEIAIIRAVTEAAQSRVIFISGSRDDVFRQDQRQARYHDNPEQIAKRTAPGHAPAPRRTSEAQPSFEADLALLLAKLRRVDIRQAIVVDLTIPEIGIPVVKLIVPGLEGYMGQSYVGGARARAAVARAREAQAREAQAREAHTRELARETVA